jgi:uncharacterized membrane protein YhhN
MAAIGPALPVATTLVGLSALLIAKRYQLRAGVWIAKPIAAAGFLALALSVGALETRYGIWIFCGLTLSFVGDVLLIPERSRNAFRAGIASFLLGHVAYTVAFASLDIDSEIAAVAVLVVGGAGIGAMRWLWPHVSVEMRVPVVSYVAVISCMLVAAAGCASAMDRPDLFVGALLFYLSDLSVARDRFVHASFWNGAWGLPFYFVAQLILAYGSGA